MSMAEGEAAYHSGRSGPQSRLDQTTKELAEAFLGRP